MRVEEINKKIEENFPGRVIEVVSEAVDPWVEVESSSLHDIMAFLKSEPALGFDALMCLSGIDYGKESELGVAYHLFSTENDHRFTVKVKVPRDNAVVPSVADLWRTANWHEREAYDLFGITFEGHPDLTRILLPEDWEGFPLRKDYVIVKTYQGIRFKD